MTYLVALVFADGDSLTSVIREGVSMHQMKATVREMIATHQIPAGATIHIEQEQPRKLIFRYLLSSLPSFQA